MANFRVTSFEGRPETFCGDPHELLSVLQSLSQAFLDRPTLVNVDDLENRAAIVGLGARVSTLQLIDKLGGKTYRMLSKVDAGDDYEFFYQGEATFVRPEFIVQSEKALAATIAWVADGVRESSEEWLSGAYPPRRVR